MLEGPGMGDPGSGIQVPGGSRVWGPGTGDLESRVQVLGALGILKNTVLVRNFQIQLL